jgi:hypothetical protein
MRAAKNARRTDERKRRPVMMHEAGERTEDKSVSDIAQYATTGNDNDLLTLTMHTRR